MVLGVVSVQSQHSLASHNHESLVCLEEEEDEEGREMRGARRVGKKLVWLGILLEAFTLRVCRTLCSLMAILNI